MENRDFKIFSGNANEALAKEIACYLGVQMGKAYVGRFQDGEISIIIDESVRGSDVFVVQPTCYPVNENVMELLILIDTLRRASAKRIIAVLPYYGYARQERKSKPRDPISAKLLANLITTAGADRVLTMDLHAPAIQGFFDIPVDHLQGFPILADYFREKQLDNLCVVSPDLGGLTRARKFAERIGASISIIDKRRPVPNVSEIMHVIGDIQEKTVIMIDDIIDTAGTITEGAQALRQAGAGELYACCTHAVLSGAAVDKLENSPFAEIVVTNTIPLDSQKHCNRLKVLSVAPLIGQAITRIYKDLSISTLFS